MKILNPEAPPSMVMPRFSSLPAEMRLAIWEMALDHERYQTIRLISTEETTASGDFNDGSYDVVVFQERQAISKLFRINRESRNAAKRFYRVHLPCRHKWHDKKERGMLFLNPEKDTIYLKGASPFFDRFADAIYQADRRCVGLVNLAFEVLPSHAPSILLLRPILARLQRVLFVMNWPNTSREHQGSPWGCHDLPPYARGCNLKSINHLYAHPVVVGSSVKFDRLTKDPRDVEIYLKDVFFERLDPCRMVGGWFGLLEALEIDSERRGERSDVMEKYHTVFRLPQRPECGLAGTFS